MSRRVAHASIWAIAGGGAQYVTVFVLLVYLAHILAPRDFGLMATISIGLDLGLQIARWGQVELLQQPHYRNDDSRNLSFRLSVAIGAVFAAGFVAAGGPMARYFEAPQLATMFYLCAPIFVLSAGSVVAEAELRGQFRFQQLAFRNTISTVVGGALAILLASLGQGALALAVQRLVQVGMASIWVWSAVAWRPSFVRLPRNGMDLVRQGGHVMIGSILPLLVPRSIDFFVGFQLGAIQLGLMRVAFRVNDFVAQMVVLPLVSVATAQLSGLGDDLPAMQRSYLGLTQASAALMCPVLVGLALVAPEAIPLTFGRRWAESVPLVQILSLLAFAAPINYYFTAAMVALGKSRIVMRQGVFQILFGIALAALAARHSLTAVVIAHVVRGAVVSIYNIVDLRRYMKLPLRALAASMAPPYLGTLAMAALVVAARLALPSGSSPLLTLIVLSAVGAIGYGGAVLLGAAIGLWPRYVTAIGELVPVRLRGLRSRA
jgi:O-antigen/teichoic acid export membrane protein